MGQYECDSATTFAVVPQWGGDTAGLLRPDVFPLGFIKTQSNVGGDSASTWWVSTAFHSADERHDMVDFITTLRHLETNMNVSIGRLPIKCQNKTVLFGMSYCKWIILPNKCLTITCCKDSLFLKDIFFLPNT